MKKNILLAVIILIAIIFGYALATPVPDAKQETKILTEPTIKPVPLTQTPTGSYEKAYMESCVEETDGFENGEAYCQCTYDVLKNRLGLDGLVLLSVDYLETNEMPDEMWDAVRECYDKL
jgi:hypothetical protein